jgi:hypothetical protein
MKGTLTNPMANSVPNSVSLSQNSTGSVEQPPHQEHRGGQKNQSLSSWFGFFAEFFGAGFGRRHLFTGIFWYASCLDMCSNKSQSFYHFSIR